MWLGPFVADQFSVPTEQGFGLNEASAQWRRSRSRLNPAKSARSGGRRAGRNHLAAEDGNLVAKHDELDGQIAAVTPIQAE